MNVSYAGQSPFLEHASIRDNMVYHNHSSLFAIEILETCAFLPDTKILEAGDQTDMSRYASYDGRVMAKPFEGTEMGEKGVSLS